MRTQLFTSEELVVAKTLELFTSSPEALTDFLTPVFEKDVSIVRKHKRAQYVSLFYKEDENKKQVAPRRYWAKPEILSWDIFNVEAEAYKFGALTYEAYVAYIQENVSNLKIAEIVLKLAYCLITGKEAEEKISGGEWDEWLFDVSTWYARAFIETLWFGKSKEHFALPVMRVEAEKYGLKIVKTSTENDMKFMIDFVCLRLDTNTQKWLPLFGISIKGLSWYYSNEKADVAYQIKGEQRENVGHKKFQREHKASVITVVSDPEVQNGLMPIVGTMRETLQKFEAQGIISK